MVTDRTDKQFIVTLAAAAGATAVTLLNWTNQIVGYGLLGLTALLVIYATVYSRLRDDNPLKRFTHVSVKGWSAYTVMLGAFLAIFALNFWRANALHPTGFSSDWPDA